ncbi:MAG TPA: ABC transporter ATP-binding protein [Bryobacteraceae bacterium]|jgi:ABC-2 type transport system ATP-binding protein|nr:ABC transporter ATP-binding protein [Bryobacteraceae bacterium]
MTEFAIEAVGLRKSFKGHEALCGLHLTVPQGCIFGFLGRNGAGKTTTIRILMGLAKADQGSARIFGMAPGDGTSGAALLRRIGFVTEDKELYPYMTVAEIIRFSRPFFPKWRGDLERRYLNVFDLPPNKKISDLSKGMRSKLMLLLAISHGAELLVLDEPTDGLDPVALEEVLRELVALSASDGTTIFFSSHQLAEVEQIADQIAIIDQGRAIVGGALEDLKRRYQRICVVFADGVRGDIRWADGAEHIRREGRMVSILAGRNVEAIMAQARSLPGTIVERYPVTLKELFLDHMRAN